VSTLHFLLLFKNNDSTTKKASKICHTHSRKQNLVTTVPYPRKYNTNRETHRQRQRARQGASGIPKKKHKKKKWQKILSAEFILFFSFFGFLFLIPSRPA
jgi:hypothetical protein